MSSMPAAENKLAARRFIEEVLNRRDYEAAARFFTDDAVDHFTGSATAFLTLSAFPDYHLNVEHVIAERDIVSVLATFTGTHLGELMGVQPTHKGVTGRVAFSFRFEGARIAETWSEIEPWTLLQQLGVHPGAAAAA
jgi:predicted ester cyclase